MYMLWDPGLSGDIRVPLGLVQWRATGHASGSAGTFTVQADSSSSDSGFVGSTAYPLWPAVIVNNPIGCGPSSGSETLARHVPRILRPLLLVSQQPPQAVRRLAGGVASHAGAARHLAKGVMQ